MAKKKRSRKAKSCKIVSVCGKRRRICWGKKGITSNKAASGGSTKKRGKKASKKGAKTAIPMSRRTGPKTKNGKRCKFGVVKSGKRAGNCLQSKRSKK